MNAKIKKQKYKNQTFYSYKNFSIINKTKVPLESLCKLIDFCKHKLIGRIPVSIIFTDRVKYKRQMKYMPYDFIPKKEKSFSGYAINTYDKKDRLFPIIIITICQNQISGTYGKRPGEKEDGYLHIRVENQIEDAIVVLSHELYHVVQFKKEVPLGPKIRETEADRYAIRMLKKWRNRKVYKD